jgi:hypothetical protein
LSSALITDAEQAARVFARFMVIFESELGIAMNPLTRADTLSSYPAIRVHSIVAFPYKIDSET